ncbi:putative EF-hand domain pair protein [Rosa chinensis]|uniref:Putative EF-hand domain pair protein n=1 Tax=Rosa chinensis TaxID=74649 RepID=A0A2P6SDC9_ROSCH|nr:uncharacterized protein LOC112182573 [Rosa chinensis]PRQ56689.1 putative EF-hand domain pair protein [Rosa chinensis]
MSFSFGLPTLLSIHPSQTKSNTKPSDIQDHLLLLRHRSQPNHRGRFCISQYSAMGQVLDKLQGKQWRRQQIRKITDKVFDHFKNETGRANLTFEDVYIGVLLVYNDINKRLPGPHFDPPSKDAVRLLIQEHDVNLDREIDREEFAKLIKHITADTLVIISQGMIVTLVAAPTIAMATKKATEGVPHVGKVVQRIPTSVYASLVTLVVMMVQHACQEP